ncbi:MAG: diguanylate cyclase [Anaerovoracaceae bacterium]
MKKLRALLATYNKNYDKNINAILDEDLFLTQVVIILMILVMASLIITAYAIRDTHLVPAYATVILPLLALLLVDIHVRRNPDIPHAAAIVKACMYLGQGLLYAFCATIIFFGGHAIPISYVAMLILLPMLYVDRLYLKVIYQLTAISVFVILELVTFPPSVSRNDWIVNAIVAGLTSLVCAIYTSNKKISNYEVSREYAKKSQTDPLTGLMNLRKFYIDAERFKADGQLSGVIVADVDRFKHFNDTFGHAYGDEILRLVSSALREYGQENHIMFYRYGGDEFTGLVLSASGLTAKAAAEGAADAVDTAWRRVPQNSDIPVRISAGYAEVGAAPLEEYLKAADYMMYDTKKSRRSGDLPR